MILFASRIFVITGNGLIFLYVLTVFAMQRGMIFQTICLVCKIFILNAKGKASQFKTWSFQIIMICFRMSRCLKNFMKSLLPLNCLPRLGKLICKNGRFLLCSDTLPQNGPDSCLPGEPQHKVKLKLKKGVQIRSKKPYRIPEAYRDDLSNTISKLLEFKLIEPSISKYSNPIFLVPNPDNKDGTKGGMRLVWDGRSVNNAIEFDAYMIPRVEDLMDRIGLLKHLTSQHVKDEMWISTLDLSTSFCQLMLDEDSRPLTSFSCTSGQFQWICMPMGLLVSSVEMERFSESVLKDFANSNTYEYHDAQGHLITSYDSTDVYIDDISVVTFGTRDEHEVLLRRVLQRMNVCHLHIQTSKCEFFRHETTF
jgi:hypothetical protein